MNIEERNTEWCYSLDTTVSQRRVVDTLAYPIVVRDGAVSIGASTDATAEELLRGLVRLILES